MHTQHARHLKLEEVAPAAALGIFVFVALIALTDWFVVSAFVVALAVPWIILVARRRPLS
jgi:hypothetical protein